MGLTEETLGNITAERKCNVITVRHVSNSFSNFRITPKTKQKKNGQAFTPKVPYLYPKALCPNLDWKMCSPAVKFVVLFTPCKQIFPGQYLDLDIGSICIQSLNSYYVTLLMSLTILHTKQSLNNTRTDQTIWT